MGTLEVLSKTDCLNNSDKLHGSVWAYGKPASSTSWNTRFCKDEPRKILASTLLGLTGAKLIIEPIFASIGI